jgi:antitoxin component YwqK of YwqJK toxin-antitoxin module
MLGMVFFLYLSIHADLAFSQKHKLITTYYDGQQKQIKEQYFVLKKQAQYPDSSFKSFYPNGKLKLSGQYKNKVKEGLWQMYFENGNMKWAGYYQHDKPSGIWQHYHENGLISSNGAMEAGRQTGIWQYFYENGALKNTGLLKNGLKYGEWIYYHEDGSKKAQATFYNDSGIYQEFYPNGNIKAKGEIVAGLSNGLWKYYYENKTLKAEGFELNGVKQGMWKFYHPNGNMMSEGIYREGNTAGNWKYFYPNGKLSSEGVEQSGKKEGPWTLYYNTGEIKGEANFENGNGIYKEYYENGKLKIEGRIENEMNQGLWRYFYENGKLEGQCQFVDGKGIYTGFYESGSIKMEGQVVDGLKTGVWKLYKEEGGLAGYYSNYQELEKKIVPQIKASIKDTLRKDTLIINIPKVRLKKKKSRHFTPKINEFRSIILASNPLGVFVYRVPVSIEYYFQERLGYEFGVQYLREPFFVDVKNIPVESMFYRGYSVYLRQKFYQPDQDIGMFYFGHEIRATQMTYAIKYKDTSSIGIEINKQPFINQYLLEYSLLVGDRIMGDAKKKGITADFFLGLGLGYRLNMPSWKGNNEQYNELFETAPQSNFNVSIRFGIMLGYALGKKR